MLQRNLSLKQNGIYYLFIEKNTEKRMKYSDFLTCLIIMWLLWVRQAALKMLKGRIWPPGHSLPMPALVQWHFVLFFLSGIEGALITGGAGLLRITAGALSLCKLESINVLHSNWVLSGTYALSRSLARLVTSLGAVDRQPDCSAWFRLDAVKHIS